MLKLLYVLYYVFLDRDCARPRRGKSPQDFTLEETRALVHGHAALLGIALNHHDEDVACTAAEGLVDTDEMRILLYSQEAQLVPRMIVLSKLDRDQDLMVEIAIRDDVPALAMLAAHHVSSKAHVPQLQKSKYPTVRLIGLMKEHDRTQLKRILKDPDKKVRERAQERLRELTAN